MFSFLKVKNKTKHDNDKKNGKYFIFLNVVF